MSQNAHELHCSLVTGAVNCAPTQYPLSTTNAPVELVPTHCTVRVWTPQLLLLQADHAEMEYANDVHGPLLQDRDTAT